MVKTWGGSSTKKRTDVDSKVAASASKRPRKEASPSPPPAEPVVSSIVTEATKPTPPPILKGVHQKARASKPSKDFSESTSFEMLPSEPNSPLPKSPLSLPSKTVKSHPGMTSGLL